MRKVWTCLTSVGSCFVLAAVWGMLAFPESALAAKPFCGDGICQKKEVGTSCADCAGGGGGDEGQFKDIPVCILLLDEVSDGVQSDGGGVEGEYCNNKKNKITAQVGRNRHIALVFGDRSGRTLDLNLAFEQTCSCSTEVDVHPIDGSCDDPTICSDALPLGSTQLLSDVRFLMNVGEDLDDLPFGCTHEDNANLRFTDDAGDTWELRWGPYIGAGGPAWCPGSGHITVTRMTDNTWGFTTTGNHLACLYRKPSVSEGLSEYHGQFFVPFGGVATAVNMDQTAPVASCPKQVDRDRWDGNGLFLPICNVRDPDNPVCAD